MTDYRKSDAYGPPQFPATDIVERLRGAARAASPAFSEFYTEAADKIDVQRSQIKWQADEIERLRGALEKIADHHGEDHICTRIARAGLIAAIRESDEQKP